MLKVVMAGAKAKLRAREEATEGKSFVMVLTHF
jgi:hypothetical protein